MYMHLYIHAYKHINTYIRSTCIIFYVGGILSYIFPSDSQIFNKKKEMKNNIEVLLNDEQLIDIFTQIGTLFIYIYVYIYVYIFI